MMIEQKEAVIFDLDGTMTDSMWIWEEIDQDFFRQQGLPMPEHLHEEIEGMSFPDFCWMLFWMRAISQVALMPLLPVVMSIKGNRNRMYI